MIGLRRMAHDRATELLRLTRGARGAAVSDDSYRDLIADLERRIP